VSGAVLDRLGLGRRDLRAWALYDGANSAFSTTVVTAVFPIFFIRVAAAGLTEARALALFAWATALAVIVVAVLTPLLGALADSTGRRRLFLGLFAALGIVATAGMGLIDAGEWRLALLLFVLGNIGAAGSVVFYDALLPHIASGDLVDRVSAAGFAIGYLGGGVLLMAQLAVILRPEAFGLADAASASRLSFVSVAVWWAVFTIPLFRHVREPAVRREADEPASAPPLRLALTRLRETGAELRHYRQAFLLLIAFAIYNDGLNTIIRMATGFGTQIGLGAADMLPAIVLVQFVGIPFTFLFGALAGRLGVKQAILLSLLVYVGISVIGFFMRTAVHFYLLAGLVGTVQGGCQALSRSLFSTLIPHHKSAEFFSFFSVFEKFAGLAGPALFALTVTATGSGRPAVLAVILFFVGGGLVLARVRVDEGRAEARAAEVRHGVAAAAALPGGALS
jgi:MFS transporter, UMF1 family